MKKIALLAVSTLFVVACSDEHTSSMGDKTKVKASDITPSSAVFVAGQNEPDFTGCKVGPSSIDSEKFKEVVCPSTDGLTVKEAVKVNDINKASLKKIKTDVITAWAADDIGVMSAAKNNELHETMNAANREQKRVDGVDAVIASGLIFLEEAKVKSSEIAKKEKDITALSKAEKDEVEKLESQLAFEKSLLRMNENSDTAQTDPALERIQDIQEKLDAVKSGEAGLEALKSERDRFLKDGEQLIVNSATNAEENIVDSMYITVEVVEEQ